MADKILFQTNVSVELALASLEGEPVEGRFGDQYRFSTVDDRVFYVSVTVGQIIEKQLMKLKMSAGEPVEIGKFEIDMGRGRKGIQWVVRRVNAMPEADVVAPAPVNAPSNNNGNHSKPPAIATGFAQYLLEQVNTLTAIYGAALHHASESHANVKPDDIRSFVITAYIQAGKGGQRAA